MRVLQINSTCGMGSTGKIAVDIYDTLCRDGHSGLIAFGRGENTSSAAAYKIGSDIQVKVHGVFSRITDRQGFYSVSATKKLVEKIKSYNPDIIHLHNIHGYYLNLPILFEYLSSAGKPIVWTLHDCWAFTGHCAYFSYVGCDRWKNGCFDCPQKNAYPSSIIIDNSKKNYLEKAKMFNSVKNLHIVTVSNWLAETVKESFLSKYPIKTVYNGIDLNIFCPTKSNFTERNGIGNKKIVLGVANIWEKRKGLDDFIKLASLLPGEYKIVLVGLSKEQINALPKNVLGIERTSSVKELVEIYSAADVYVNTSREETMGLTTLEALACGTPAVVYNSTAVPEVIDDTCGVCVEPGDVNGLLKEIIKISFSSEACVKRAEFFEKDKQYKEYLKIYNELI